jgi:hypothetical protein
MCLYYYVHTNKWNKCYVCILLSACADPGLSAHSSRPHISWGAHIFVILYSYHSMCPLPIDNSANAKATRERASSKWRCDDEWALVRALKKAKEDSKWGDNNPKEAAWTFCVMALSGSKRESGGLPKNANVIRRRWQCVCAHYLHCLYARLHVDLQLKTEYDLVKQMYDKSGWGWDNEKNLPVVIDDVWSAYIKVSLLYLTQLLIYNTFCRITPRRPY